MASFHSPRFKLFQLKSARTYSIFVYDRLSAFFDEVRETRTLFEQTLWNHISNFFELAKTRSLSQTQSETLESFYIIRLTNLCSDLVCGAPKLTNIGHCVYVQPANSCSSDMVRNFLVCSCTWGTGIIFIE